MRTKRNSTCDGAVYELELPVEREQVVDPREPV